MCLCADRVETPSGCRGLLPVAGGEWARRVLQGAGEAPGVWVGSGDESLGLVGEVEPADLRAVLAGLAPGTGLTPNGTTLRTHPRRVPGFDLTFAVPKSVSMAYALADRRVQHLIVTACEAAGACPARRLADLAVRPAPRGDPDPTGPIEIRLSLSVRRLARDRESTRRLVHDSLPPRCLWHAAPPVALLSDYRFESNPESNAPRTSTNAHRRLCTNALVRAISAVRGGRPWTLWRRWTGIEPAGRGSPVPTALKAAEPTRYPDTSVRQRTGGGVGIRLADGQPRRCGVCDG